MQRYVYPVTAGAFVRNQLRAYLDARGITFTEHKSWTTSIFNVRGTRDEIVTLERDLRAFNAPEN